MYDFVSWQRIESARHRPALAALGKLKKHQALLTVILKFHLLLPVLLLPKTAAALPGERGDWRGGASHN